MGDLIYQVQRLSDTAKGVAVRVGGAENVVLTDDEKDSMLSVEIYYDVECFLPFLHISPSTAFYATNAYFLPPPIPHQPHIKFLINPTQFPALQTRIEKTISILEALAPTSMDNKEESEVVLKTSSGERKFTGRDYILGFAIPNFYFHFVTAYAILRKEGVPVGKGDYLGTTLQAK
ncbi:Helix-turn-helix-domain containing type protein [Rutstroemia sp. NJR-2017a BBW]|nr:Helix-turn-helix-domain containing type protein [Rutstroemia sp. NJR-2017a BBW]